MSKLYTIREAADELGVSVYQARYVMLSRPVPRRRAGNTDLVTLDDMRRGLDDIRHEHDWRAKRRASA